MIGLAYRLGPRVSPYKMVELLIEMVSGTNEHLGENSYEGKPCPAAEDKPKGKYLSSPASALRDPGDTGKGAVLNKHRWWQNSPKTYARFTPIRDDRLARANVSGRHKMWGAAHTF